MGTLAELFLRSVDHVPEFIILQVGMASPERVLKEPYHDLTNSFRGSRILVCDPDENECERMNHNRQPDDPEYFPIALGAHGQSTPFYFARDAAWRSIYKPNADVLRRYYNTRGAMPESVARISMTGIDQFMREQDAGDADIVRVHLPWSGLQLLQSGETTLTRTLAVSMDTALLALYEGQELFGEMCQYLDTQGFIFHKFIGLYGRTFNPIVLQKNPDYISHHLWGHAMFLRDIADITKMSLAQLQKFALLADMYGSKDVAILALMEYDIRHGTQYGKIYGGLDKKGESQSECKADTG